MNSLPHRAEVVVVGAGQAGLTMSWHLRRAGRDHVVVDRRATLGGGWQDRWDGFRLVSPNWTASFPDAPYDGPEPDGYMPRNEIAGRVARYASTISAPVVLDAGVQRLRRTAAGSFELETTQGSIAATEVVVATGGFHVPHIPTLAAGLPARIMSLHSSAYRSETDLPPGAILVVGYRQDFGWIDPAIADDMGLSEVPGLLFIGSLWQHDMASATLFGVGRDARVLAERMGLGG